MASASDLVRAAAQNRPLAERGLFLREVLAHTAAALTFLEGERPAVEAVYRVADAMVGSTDMGGS